MLPLFLAIAAAAVLCAAQQVFEAASFGHLHGLSPDSVTLPGWDLSGTVNPQILSDKIVLVPPYPGNQQGALWTKERVTNPQWAVDLKFRATGPEHGGGNFQIWYTKENQADIGSNSVYTVGKFQGLVLVIDMHGGQGGGIRGFLNDGTISFKDHQHLEQVAFGHCDYSYRNLGRPTRLRIQQDSTGFEVVVDEKRCFRSDDVLLPSDYYFGLTGASSDTPDSFEVFKFVTSTFPPGNVPPVSPPPQGQTQGQTQQQIVLQRAQDQEAGVTGVTPETIQDVLASTLQSSQAQFEDLHNRIQAQGHNIENLFSEYIKSSAQMQGRIEDMHSKLAKFDQVRNLETKLNTLEAEISALRKDYEKKDYGPQFNDLQAGLNARHDTLLQNLPDRIGHIVHSRGPRIGLWVLLIIGLQFASIGGYILYKRRKNAVPKKYL